MVAATTTRRALSLSFLALLAARPVDAQLTAAGPSRGNVMWQGMQQEFVQPDGTHCRGRTALAVSKNAVCYVSADDKLRCAGKVYGRTFGPQFEDVGMSGVEQILLSPTRKTIWSGFPLFRSTLNAVCVKKTDGTAWCSGYNPDGQLGSVVTGSSSTFQRWGCSNDLVALGTGNWEQVCGLDRKGRVSCAGKSYGTFPTPQPGTGHGSFWIDPSATLHVDDGDTFRASNGLTNCRVRPRTPGQVLCHGTPNGAISCRQLPAEPDDLACFGATPWFFGPSSAVLWKPEKPAAPLIVDGGTLLKTYPGVGVCGSPAPQFGEDYEIPVSCWLTVHGKVFCMCRLPLNTPAGVVELFERTRKDDPDTQDWSRIVAMATDPHSETVCAVPGDGSLWCIGENASGKLGTGLYDPLDKETQVLPPGSVRTGCEGPVGVTTTTTLPPLPPPTGACACPAATRLSFTTRAGAGTCGKLTLANGVVMKDLACGALHFGGGGNAVPLGVVQPDGTSPVFAVTGCGAGGTLTLGPRTSAEEGPRRCTDAGCLFGAPVPVPNEMTPPVSSCLVNRLTVAASGTASCASGNVDVSMPLASEIFLTGDTATDPKNVIPGAQPCPICAPSLAGYACSGSDPCAPCCHGGTRNLQPCTPESGPLGDAFPTSQDCPPDPMLSVGTLPLGFSLSSGTVAWLATTATNDTETEVNMTRVFAGFCRDYDDTGAFGMPAQKCWENGMAVGAPCGGTFETCEQRNNGAFGPAMANVRNITLFGAPAGSLVDAQPHAATLASVFAVPPTFDATVDAAADLPGPGAVTLPADVVLLP